MFAPDPQPAKLPDDLQQREESPEDVRGPQVQAGLQGFYTNYTRELPVAAHKSSPKPKFDFHFSFARQSTFTQGLLRIVFEKLHTKPIEEYLHRRARSGSGRRSERHGGEGPSVSGRATTKQHTLTAMIVTGRETGTSK